MPHAECDFGWTVTLILSTTAYAFCQRVSMSVLLSAAVPDCRWTTAPLDTTCSALLESVKVPDLTRTTLESLNPNLNCSTPIGSAWQTNQTSVCVAGRAVDPEGNYDDVANPARTTLLGQIVTALAAVQPGLTDLYR